MKRLRALSFGILAGAIFLVAVPATSAPPAIDPIPDQVVLEGWTVTHQVTATDPDGDPLTYSVTGAAWISIDSGTGLLTIAPPGGTAAPGGSIELAQVEVTDGVNTATAAFNTRVLDTRADQHEHGGGLVTGGVSTEGPTVQLGGWLEHALSGVTAEGHMAYITTEADLALGGPAGLSFGRFYHSLLERDQIQHGHLGRNWLGTYDWVTSANVPGTLADVTTNRGGKHRFQSAGPMGWTLVAPEDVPHRLAQNGPEFQFFDASAGSIYIFDATSRRLLRVEDGHGNVLTMGYAGALLTSVTDPFGRMLSFAYDPLDRLTSVSDGTRSVLYGYDPGGNLATVTDAGSQVTAYNYAAGPLDGLLTQVVEPVGNIPLTYGYGPNGEVTTVTDSNGMTWFTTGYRDPSGRVTVMEVIRPVPGAIVVRNDLDGRSFQYTDPAGGVTLHTLDSKGRVHRRTRPLGDYTDFGYDPASGYTATILWPNLTSTSYTYAGRSYGALTLFDPQSVTRRDGTTVNYAYDAAGNLTTLTDPGLFTWSWTYNALGQPLTFTNPASGVITYSYDPMGRLGSVADHVGNTTVYAYDALDRLTEVTEPGAPPRTYTYDAMNRPLTATNELGKTWTHAYDDNGRLQTATDPLGAPHRFIWDAMDRLAGTETPLGGQTFYSYDPVGRLAAVTDPTSRMTTYEYDDVGRFFRVRDGAGNATTYTYDANGRIVERADPLSNTETYTYDLMDRLLTLTDPVSTTFTFTHDAMDRLRSVTGPLGYLREYDYDARGLLTRSALGGVDEQYTRTPLGQVERVRDPNGNFWLRGYDAGGRLLSMSDPLGRTTSYTYDARNRPSVVTMPLGIGGFGFDAASRLTQRSYSDGTLLNYSYDDVGRLLATQGASFTYDADGRITTSAGGIGYGYDPAGRLTALTHAPGKTVTYQYDPRGLLRQVNDWVGGVTEFTHDAAGRRTRLQRPDGSRTEYTYNETSWIVTLVDLRSDTTASVTIDRDALGRVAEVKRRAPLHPIFKNETATYAYDAAGQITGYSYDAMGRLLSDGTRSYEWDLASRLKLAAAATESIRFDYDGLGGVVRRTLGAEVEEDVRGYVTMIDMRGQVWGEERPARRSSPSVNYVYAPSGELLHSVDDVTGARRFYHFDERGNTLFLSNDVGSVVTAYGYTVSGSSVDLLGQKPQHMGDFTFGAQAGVVQEGTDVLYRTPSGGMYDGRTARLLQPCHFTDQGFNHLMILDDRALYPAASSAPRYRHSAFGNLRTDRLGRFQAFLETRSLPATSVEPFPPTPKPGQGAYPPFFAGEHTESFHNFQGFMEGVTNGEPFPPRLLSNATWHAPVPRFTRPLRVLRVVALVPSVIGEDAVPEVPGRMAPSMWPGGTGIIGPITVPPIVTRDAPASRAYTVCPDAPASMPNILGTNRAARSETFAPVVPLPRFRLLGEDQWGRLTVRYSLVRIPVHTPEYCR